MASLYPVQLKVLSQLVCVPDGVFSTKPRKLAVTLISPVMVTVIELLVPLASPDQSVNVNPVPGIALNETTDPAVYFPLQFSTG